MALLSRVKTGELITPIKEHQQRPIDKLRASGGVLVAHGVGSGKTLTSIAAQDALGLPADIVTPAPLIHNYEKELLKHHRGGHLPTRIRSYEKAVQPTEGVDPSGLVIFDEAHRGRNAGTATSGLLRQAGKAQARMLLTGTPIYNQPSDLAPLINAASGQPRLPTNPQEFNKRYVGEESVSPGFFARMAGATPGSYSVLKNKQDLIDKTKGYIDVHPGGGEDFPSVEENHIHVPMSDVQNDVYKFHEGKLPFWTRFKVRSNLPLDKAESTNLNKFYAGLRQTSNTPRPYSAKMTDEQEEQAAPKLRRVIERIEEMQKADPNYRGVVYSNYLDSGLNPLARMLAKKNIGHGLFHGGIGKQERKGLVNQYNEGKLPVLMISGAGAEGLDLKGTKHINVVDPHFNESRIQQVIGRGARYRSHAHLPEAERKVLVDRYYSTKPESVFNRMGVGKPDTAFDEFLYNRAKEKDLLSKQILEALQEASDYGPLKPEDRQ